MYENHVMNSDVPPTCYMQQLVTSAYLACERREQEKNSATKANRRERREPVRREPVRAYPHV